MKIRLGGTNSSLWQRNVRQRKAEQNHYFERLKLKTLGEQRPPAKAIGNASKTA